MSWVYTILKYNLKRNKIPGRVMCFECNFCGIGFKRRFTAIEGNHQVHFCKPSCASSYNMTTFWSNPKNKERMIEVFNRPEVKEKYRVATLKNIDQILIKREITQADPNSYFNSEEAKLNRSNARLKMLEDPIIYENFIKITHSNEANEKRKLTWQDPNSYFNSQEVADARSKAMSEIWKDQNYRDNQHNKQIEARNTPEFKEKLKIVLNSSKVREKSRNTAKLNNSFPKSKSEENIYNLLLKYYNIKRQIYFNKKILDFLLTDLNVYIEVDGIYWHGIGKTEEELVLKDNPQGKNIYKKYLSDQILNKYCLDNKIRLLRITDIISNKIIKNNDIELLKQLIDRTATEYVVCYYKESNE